MVEKNNTTEVAILKHGIKHITTERDVKMFFGGGISLAILTPVSVIEISKIHLSALLIIDLQILSIFLLFLIIALSLVLSDKYKEVDKLVLRAAIGEFDEDEVLVTPQEARLISFVDLDKRVKKLRLRAPQVEKERLVNEMRERNRDEIKAHKIKLKTDAERERTKPQIPIGTLRKTKSKQSNKLQLQEDTTKALRINGRFLEDKFVNRNEIDV